MATSNVHANTQILTITRNSYLRIDILVVSIDIGISYRSRSITKVSLTITTGNGQAPERGLSVSSFICLEDSSTSTIRMAGLTTMASLHLRRTFRYPEELDIDDGMREEPDEEGKNPCLQDT